MPSNIEPDSRESADAAEPSEPAGNVEQPDKDAEPTANTGSEEKPQEPQSNVELPQPQTVQKTANPLGEDTGAVWFVRPPSGGQYGPADAGVMRTWIQQGRVPADALVWREGWTDWLPAVEVFPGLALRRWLPDDGGSQAKPPPVPPAKTPTDTQTVAPAYKEPPAEKQPAPLVDEPSSKQTTTQKNARRSPGVRDKRRRQLTLVIVLSSITLALGCVLIWILMR